MRLIQPSLSPLLGEIEHDIAQLIRRKAEVDDLEPSAFKPKT